MSPAVQLHCVQVGLILSVITFVVAAVMLVKELRRPKAPADPMAEVLMAAMRLHDIAERAKRDLVEELTRADRADR